MDGADEATAQPPSSCFKKGQKYKTPPISDPTRVFYESLLEENPDSVIAIRYCVEHGLLPAQDLKRFLKKYKKVNRAALKMARERQKAEAKVLNATLK